MPVLIDEAHGAAGNPWGVSFMAMLHMSNDSGLFRTAAQLRAAGARRNGPDWVYSDGTRAVPMYEAKMIHQYDHRFGSYPDGHIEDTRALPRPTLEQQCDPKFEASPRYWVAESEVADRLAAKRWTRSWLMGWRDITNSTNERTLISGLVPVSGCGDKFLLMQPEVPPPFQVALYGCLNSLVCDYVARQKIGSTSFKYFTMKQISVPPPAAYTEADLAFIVPRVLELTYTSHAMAPFARDLGFEGKPFAWNEDRRAQLRAELDAFYARAYGLTRAELRYILNPEDAMGPGYPSETFRVLKKNEIARFGEYRTARLVLAAWDAQESDARPAGARHVG